MSSTVTNNHGKGRAPGRASGGVRLHFSKDAHKFSAAHMTLFPDGTKERLHGHNYQVETVVEIAGSEGSAFLSFADLKQTIRGVCEALDERILIPRRSPFLTATSHADELEVRAAGKRYVFPADEVVFIDADNVVTETLAAEVARRLAAAWQPLVDKQLIFSLEVTVRETLGQGASVFVRMDG